MLREELPENEKDYYSQRLEYNSRLLAMNQYETDVLGCYVIGENGMYFKSSTNSWEDDVDFWNCEWYQTVIETRESLWISHQDGSFLVNDLDAPVLTLVMPIQDRASTNILGVVVTDILAEDVLTAAEEDAAFAGELYLLSEDNEIICSNENTADGNASDEDAADESPADISDRISQVLADADLTEDFTGEIQMDGEKYLLSNRMLEVSGWKLTGLISYADLYADLRQMRNVMIAAVIIATLFAIIFALTALARFTKPILAMQSTMEQVAAGDLDARVKVQTKDEIGSLGEHFNDMICQVNDLMEQEKENQDKLRKAELKALQAQINPHFLYNALDSINWLARMKRNDEVIRMINALSGFYRISLSRGRTYITLEEEFRHAENYITIQQLRYKKLLNYEIDLPEGLGKYTCLKMILQPLIENSIYHGIKEKGVAGTVRITASEQSDEIWIRVSDDGMGMEKEQLEKIRELLEGDQEYNSDAYGIINVQRRLKMYFGREYGIEIDSAAGEWTVVTVRIPKKEGETNALEGNSGGR